MCSAGPVRGAPSTLQLADQSSTRFHSNPPPPIRLPSLSEIISRQSLISDSPSASINIPIDANPTRSAPTPYQIVSTPTPTFFLDYHDSPRTIVTRRLSRKLGQKSESKLLVGIKDVSIKADNSLQTTNIISNHEKAATMNAVNGPTGWTPTVASNEAMEECDWGLQHPKRSPGTPSLLYRDYPSASKYVRSLSITREDEWEKIAHPIDIPKSPDRFFEGCGWSNWTLFLTGKSTAQRHRNDFHFLYFEVAREFARKLGFKSLKQWQRWAASGQRPDNIPADPYAVYKKDFKGYGDFLGHGRQSNHKCQFPPYEEVHKFVLGLDLKSEKNWREWSRSCRPPHIPSDPYRVYRNKGWVSWRVFLRGYDKQNNGNV